MPLKTKSIYISIKIYQYTKEYIKKTIKLELRKMKINTTITYALAIIFLLTIITILSTTTSTIVNASNVSTFTVSLTLNNSAPTITAVQAVSDSPAEGTTKAISFYFNASDGNGAQDIPAANAQVIINKSGQTTRASGSICTILSTVGTTNAYQCNVTIYYYDGPGSWTINASVFDGASSMANNLSVLYTNGNIFGIGLKLATMTFSGSPGQENISASNNPQVINNTGNNAFTKLNLTAYNLMSGSNVIAAGNFTANITSSGGLGQTLSNGTSIALTNSNISVQSTTNMYVYIDVPLGVGNGTYTSQAAWIVTAT